MLKNEDDRYTELYSSNVAVNGENIEKVQSFEYLGLLIDGDGDCSKEIKRRLSMASKQLMKLEKLWQAMDVEMKLRVLRAIVFPTAAYGCRDVRCII